MARQGKIARLPAVIRLEINLKLLDGQGAPQILPWLNSQVDAIRIWDELFEGVPCSPQNLSEWKLGGYKEWRKSRERLEDLKDLTAYAFDVVKATNSNISDAAARIAAGHIVETMEAVGNIAITGGSEDAEKDPNKGLSLVVGAIAKLQKGDRDKEASERKDKALALQQRRHELNEKQAALAEAKFQNGTVEKFLEWAKRPEAAAILNSGKSKQVQMAQLRELFFGPVKQNQA